MYKIKINKEKCIGCGACAALCPEVFQIKAGKATAKKPTTEKECAKQAADACPVCAIALEKA